MDNYSKIEALKKQMDGFIYQEFVIILIAVVIVSGISMLYYLTNGSNNYKRVLVSILLVGAGCFTFIGIVNNYFVLSEELDGAEAALISDLSEKSTAVTNKIVKAQTTKDKYCPHVELKEGEKCTFLEFLTEDEKVMQVYIALDTPAYADSDKPKEITYLKLNEEDRKFLNNYYNELGDNGLNVYPNVWSLGTLIE